MKSNLFNHDSIKTKNIKNVAACFFEIIKSNNQVELIYWEHDFMTT